MTEDAVPRDAPLCPLCGARNDCAVASTGRFDAPCWCAGVVVDRAALERLAPAQRGAACLCPACALGVPRDDNDEERR